MKKKINSIIQRESFQKFIEKGLCDLKLPKNISETKKAKFKS
jgi:hypothetical protein